MSTIAPLVESTAIACVLVAAIGLTAFVFFYATDALERQLDQPDQPDQPDQKFAKSVAPLGSDLVQLPLAIAASSLTSSRALLFTSSEMKLPSA